jgi:hypothetical protein
MVKVNLTSSRDTRPHIVYGLIFFYRALYCWTNLKILFTTSIIFIFTVIHHKHFVSNIFTLVHSKLEFYGRSIMPTT